MILVVDNFCAKLVSQFCSLFELIRAGDVYQIESLTVKRKRYPQSHVIYFVDGANRESIERVIADFPADEDDELSFD